MVKALLRDDLGDAALDLRHSEKLGIHSRQRVVLEVPRRNSVTFRANRNGVRLGLAAFLKVRVVVVPVEEVVRNLLHKKPSIFEILVCDVETEVTDMAVDGMLSSVETRNGPRDNVVDETKRARDLEAVTERSDGLAFNRKRDRAMTTSDTNGRDSKLGNHGGSSRIGEDKVDAGTIGSVVVIFNSRMESVGINRASEPRGVDKNPLPRLDDGLKSRGLSNLDVEVTSNNDRGTAMASDSGEQSLKEVFVVVRGGRATAGASVAIDRMHKQMSTFDSAFNWNNSSRPATSTKNI